MAGRRLDEQRRVVDHLRSTFKDAGVRLRYIVAAKMTGGMSE